MVVGGPHPRGERLHIEARTDLTARLLLSRSFGAEFRDRGDDGVDGFLKIDPTLLELMAGLG